MDGKKGKVDEVGQSGLGEEKWTGVKYDRIVAKGTGRSLMDGRRVSGRGAGKGEREEVNERGEVKWTDVVGEEQLCEATGAR